MVKNVRLLNRKNVVINFAIEELVNLHPLVEEIVKGQKLKILFSMSMLTKTKLHRHQ